MSTLSQLFRHGKSGILLTFGQVHTLALLNILVCKLSFIDVMCIFTVSQLSV